MFFYRGVPPFRRQPNGADAVLYGSATRLSGRHSKTQHNNAARSVIQEPGYVATQLQKHSEHGLSL
jgi:hypothetical protein